MLPPLRRWVILSLLVLTFFLVIFHTLTGTHRHHRRPPRPIDKILNPGLFKPKFRWKNVKQHYPVESFAALPAGSIHIPRIQHDFEAESLEHAVERRKRLRSVEATFKHSWEGYKNNAWLQDEVSPISGKSRNPFGGWGATLVDSLDTLWIMGWKKEFETAVSAIKHVEFTTAGLEELNVFETTIRYLGGLLGAYDVSGHKYKVLLTKAVDLGEMLYMAFDTPNRMPVTRWNWQNTALGLEQEAKKQSLVAEVGSLTLEFTRLSQLTGDPKWYDAVQRVTELFEVQQNHTKIPGLWPTMIDPKTGDFTGSSSFTFGGMADSLYEYLPKQHIMVGGRVDSFQDMYLTALPKAKEHLFIRALNPENRSLLIPATVKRWSMRSIKLQPEGEHLACFTGGFVALGAKVFHQAHDLQTARELVDGCIWAYDSMPSNVAPEIFTILPCKVSKNANCTWDEDEWQRAVVKEANRGSIPDSYADQAQTIIEQQKLAKGFTKINDARYILRPEAIESIFVLYRITGDKTLQDAAWRMFEAITNSTRTSIAHAALKDVRQLKAERQHLDTMESFWTAETLKYFYLIFSNPDVISLDDFVLNTEAHPLLRPK